MAADWTGLSQEVLHVQFGTRFNGTDGRDAAPRNYATYLTYIACVQLGQSDSNSLDDDLLFRVTTVLGIGIKIKERRNQKKNMADFGYRESNSGSSGPR